MQVTATSGRETALRLAALFSSTSVKTGSLLQAIEESGLTLTQMKVLAAAAGEDAEASRPASEIAGSVGISMPTASRAIDALVKKRLVTRAEDDQDRRIRRIAVTAKGGRLVAELIAQRTASLEAFVEGLDDTQRRRLNEALDVLLVHETVARAYRQLKDSER